jgi:hypothetical protein
MVSLRELVERLFAQFPVEPSPFRDGLLQAAGDGPEALAAFLSRTAAGLESEAQALKTRLDEAMRG